MNFLNDMRISRKLPIIIVVCAILSAFVIAVLSYVEAKHAVVDGQKSKLMALKETRKNQLGDYLSSIEEDLVAVASNPYTFEALRAFENGWDELGFQGNQSKILRDLYITSNPHKAGEKEKLDYAKDQSLYSKAHASYHPWFRSFLYAREYYDIFLIDPQGNLVYSVFKEADYATNLNTGEWKDTDLAHSFRAARDSGVEGEKFFFDFKSYAPSADAPASFISTPINAKNGKLQGVLIFQMPIGRINSIMQSAAGMGETGETYLVGEDFLMRSDSRFSEESTILKTKVEGETTKAGLKGESGVEIVKDYRGIHVVSAYTPMEFLGTKWVVLAEIDEAEMLAPVVAMRNDELLTMIIIAFVIVGVGIYFARMITGPISTITGVMEILASGDTSVDVPERNRKDEIGDMAQALAVFKDNRIEADRLAEEQKLEQQQQIERGKNIESITNSFEQTVSDLINGLAAASTELDATSHSMSGIAEQTTDRSSAMSVASGSTAQNIQTVAAASEELSASIRELSEQVQNTSKAANTATEEISRNTQTSAANMQELDGNVASVNEAAQSTGDAANDVLSASRELSEQTESLKKKVAEFLTQVKAA